MLNSQTQLDSANVGSLASEKLVSEYSKMKLATGADEVVYVRKSANGEVFFYLRDMLEFYVGYVTDRYSVTLYSGIFEHVPETLEQTLAESKPMVYPKS